MMLLMTSLLIDMDMETAKGNYQTNFKEKHRSANCSLKNERSVRHIRKIEI